MWEDEEKIMEDIKAGKYKVKLTCSSERLRGVCSIVELFENLKEAEDFISKNEIRQCSLKFNDLGFNQYFENITKEKINDNKTME